MIFRDFLLDDSSKGGASRRALLRTIVSTPVAVFASRSEEALASLHQCHTDSLAIIARTRAGRSLSRHRYHRAEGFFPDRNARFPTGWHDYLYNAGITAQLGLSSHLLDVGFPDEWCARHIGLCVAKSLTYANATGFGFDCPDMTRLATVLTPYNKWNQVHLFGESKPDDGGFTPDAVQTLLRALLDRVHAVTGHHRPNGWWDRQQQAGS